MKPFFNMDPSIMKTFIVAERLKIRFRAEAANALKSFSILTVRFNTNPTSPDFSTVLRVSTPDLDCPPRVTTLGLKVNW